MRIRRAVLAAFAMFAIVGAMIIYTPRSVQAECGVYHTVQPGQNLFRISLRYGVSLSAIAAANNISNVNVIYVGQRLYIPCGTVTGTTGTTSNPGGDNGIYIFVTSTPSPTSNAPIVQSFATDPASGAPIDCTGFRGTSPDAFDNGTDTFYWDPPSYFQPARYQVRILNAAGAIVGSFEAIAPVTHLFGDTSPSSIGPGTDFYWYVVAVTADNRICQTATRYAQRSWPKGDPTVTPTP